MMICVVIMYLLYSLGRTGSVFFTTLIAIERYLDIAHYHRTKLWLTTRVRRILAISTLLFVILVNLPWWLNSTYDYVPKELSDEGPLANYHGIIVQTKFAERFYYSKDRKLFHIHLFVDFVLPFPLLIAFNGLLYKYVSTCITLHC